MRTRVVAVLAGGAAGLLLTVTGCAASDRPGAGEPDPRDAREEEVASALEDRDHPSFPDPLIDLDHLLSGGPPPDGIPPIDYPGFDTASEVEWLERDEPVLSLTVGEETRAYPLRIMTWHEIVNDTVGGRPVAVTYCPLCNSGVAFVREIDGRELTFGTSGMLYQDNLVMYDRQTESLWPQLTGLASVGAMTGSQLEAIPMGVVGWSQFREAHPDSKVLGRNTGHRRDYGRNPYVGYDRPDGELLFPVPGGTDGRLSVKERVIGLGTGEDALAVRRSAIAEAGVLEVEVGDRDVVLWHAPGQNSALDSDQIAEGRDVGSVGAFSPEVDGQRLTWRSVGDRFVDDQTGSEWDVLGRAVSGELEGRRLEPVQHLDTFWFAWVAFQPETDLGP